MIPMRENSEVVRIKSLDYRVNEFRMMYKINYGWLTVMSYGLIRMYHLRYRSYMSMAITVNGHTCGESLVKNRLESMVRNRVFRKQSGNLWNTLGKTYGKT